MHLTHAGYLDNGIWALIYQDWKPALLSLVISLSKQSANMAQWLRILRLVRWKSSRKVEYILDRCTASVVALKLIGHSLLNGMLCVHAKGSQTVCSFLPQFWLREQNARSMRWIKYEWRFWIPLVVLIVINSCCVSLKKSYKQATDWQWGGCTWTLPT